MIMFTSGHSWWLLFLVVLPAHLIQQISSSSELKNRSPSDSKRSIASPIFKHFGSWKNKFHIGWKKTFGTNSQSTVSSEERTSGSVSEGAWKRGSDHRSVDKNYEIGYPVKNTNEQMQNKQNPPRRSFVFDDKGNPKRISLLGNNDKQQNQKGNSPLANSNKQKYFKTNSLLRVILAGFKGTLFPLLGNDGDEDMAKVTDRIKNDFNDSDIPLGKDDDIETKQMNFQGFLFDTLDQSTTKPDIICSDGSPIVLNTSVDCANGSLNKITLSDDQLIQVLSDQGGSYVKDYMATSPEMANNNFKNLISLTDDYPDSNFKRHPTDWLWNYDMTKAKLLEQLEISHLQLLHVRPDALPINGYVENHWQHWMNSTRRRDETIANRLHHYLTSVKYMNHNISRHIMADDGTMSTMEYCQTRGAESADGYLHMCTTCAHTTTLPDDKFPRVLNEAVCHAQDSGCLFVGDTPHGSCRQNVFYMNMLRKKAGKCMMVIHHGATVLTDEWELYSQPIRVSCECLVNKRSPVAKNVNPN